MVDPYQTVIFHPPATWIALALLYNVALVTVAFVAATVGGIAALDLYTSAMSRPITASPERNLTHNLLSGPPGNNKRFSYQKRILLLLIS